MDQNNPIIKLCVEGMRAETEGRNTEALALFMQAWEQSTNDYDACVAAHYVARHQKTPKDILHWNQQSLVRAYAVSDESVQSFYPSLYLNMGKAHEDLGSREEAKKYYELASAKISNLPSGPYGDVVRDGIARGLQRVS
jgi:tetratricopeptide (TPR) repeat protein